MASKLEETLREELIDFALWFHPVWEVDNEDDRDKATRAVTFYLYEERDHRLPLEYS